MPPSGDDEALEMDAFAQPLGEEVDGKEDDYGEDSDFEGPGADGEEDGGDEGGAAAAPSNERGHHNTDTLGSDEHNSDDGALRSEGHANGTTADVIRQKRREKGKQFLKQRRKQERAEATRKRQQREQEEAAKRKRMEELEATRKAMLRAAGKLKSIPVVTSTERIPKRRAPSVLQPPVPGQSTRGELDGYLDSVGVSVYGKDLSPRCSIPLRDCEGTGADGTIATTAPVAAASAIRDGPKADVNRALDEAMLGDVAVEPPSTTAYPYDIAHSQERPSSTHPPQGQRQSQGQSRQQISRSPPHHPETFPEEREHEEYFGLDGHVYGTSIPTERNDGRRIGPPRPRSAGGNTQPRAALASRSVSGGGGSRVRSRSAGSARATTEKRPFRAGSVTDVRPATTGRSVSAGRARHRRGAAATRDEDSRRQRALESRKPEIPHHVFQGSNRRRRRTSRDGGKVGERESDKENKAQRPGGPSKSDGLHKRSFGGGDGGGSDDDMHAHLVDLLNDPRDSASWLHRKQNPLHPIQHTDDSELLASVKSIMENRFRGMEVPPSEQSVAAGVVLAQVDKNESAAALLLKSMDRLRNEVAGYSANVRQFAHVRESAGEIEALRASIQSRLSLAASVESERSRASGSPPSPPQCDSDSHSFDSDEDSQVEQWQRDDRDRQDTVRFGDASKERRAGVKYMTESYSDEDHDEHGDDYRHSSEERDRQQVPWRHDVRATSSNGAEEVYATDLPEYRRADKVDEFMSSADDTAILQSMDYYQRNSKSPVAVSTGEGSNYGDPVMSQQMGLLRDKREILAKYLGDAACDDNMDYPQEFTSSGDELVWGGSSYKIEKVGGLERLVRTSLDARPGQRSSTAPAVAPLSLRNVGELAGVLTTSGSGGRRDPSEYSDTGSSSDDDASPEDDHRIVTIFANEIYRQRVQEALEVEQEETRRKLLEETYHRANAEMEKDRAHSPLPHAEEPSMYVSTAEATPRSADGSGVLDDRSMSPRTYWDMMISRSTLPSPRGKEAGGDGRTAPLASSLDVTNESEACSMGEGPNSKRETAFLRAARAHEASKGEENGEVERVEQKQSQEDSSPQHRYTGAELRLMLTETLHKQENLFNIAMDLGEAAQGHTVQSATHAMQQMAHHADREASELARQHELAQMQHAYELALATTAAEASLAVQREMAAKDSTLAEMKQELLRQTLEQEQAHFLANTIHNVDLASELFDMRQMAARAEEQKRQTEADIAAAAATSNPRLPVHDESARLLRVSTATMTDGEYTLTASTSQEGRRTQSDQKSPPSRAVDMPSSRTGEVDMYGDDDDDEYSASFDEESRVFNRSGLQGHGGLQAPSVRFQAPPAGADASVASEVNESADDVDEDGEYEYSFVEESHVASSPGKADQSAGEVSESMLEGTASMVSGHDYSEDFADETALSMASVSVRSRPPARAGKPTSSSAAAASHSAVSQSGAELFAQYIADIEYRIRSQEKSIAMRLQLEKRKTEHEQQLLKNAQKSPKTALSKADYADALRSIENDYQASVAELERERWTMNARAYKERKKYEQLRRDMEVMYNAEADRPGSRTSAKAPPLTVSRGSVSTAGVTRAEAVMALRASDSYDSSFDSMSRSMGAPPASKAIPQQRQASQDLLESLESHVPAVEDSFASVVSEYRPGEPSQDMSYAQNDFEEVDDEHSSGSGHEGEAGDEYSSEVFEALSFVDGPQLSASKANKSTSPVRTLPAAPPLTGAGGSEYDIEEASNVPTLEELQQRSRLLQQKRAEAAEVIRQRTEEIERRKVLIRLEEEEREVERIVQQASRINVEEELEAHRRVARLEAKKNARVAYSEVTAKKHSGEHKRPPKGKSSSTHAASTPQQTPKSAVQPVSHAADLSHSYAYDSEEFEEDDEVAEEPDDEEYSVYTDEDGVDERGGVQEVSYAGEVFENGYDDDVYDEVSDEAENDHQRMTSVASTSHLAAVSYADDFEEEHNTTISKQQPLHVSRNASTEYLSDFEDTVDVAERSDVEEPSRSHRLKYQHSASSDTFAELDESLDRRNERIAELKKKIEKAQSSHKLEKLRTKQAERARLQQEEAELLDRLHSEEEMYRAEKARILQGTAGDDQPAADDVIVHRLIASLHEPVEQEQAVLDEEEALAEDSFSSVPGQEGESVLERAFEGQVATRVHEIEAAIKIQSLERARMARKVADRVREDRAAYAVEGDLMEEFKHTRMAQDLMMEDSFGSDSSEFSADGESARDAEVAERAVVLAAMEAKAENMKKIVAERNKMSLIIDTSSPVSADPPVSLSPSTPTTALTMQHEPPVAKATILGNDIDDSIGDDEIVAAVPSESPTSFTPRARPHVLCVEVSDISDSVTPRPDSTISALTQTPTAHLQTLPSPTPSARDDGEDEVLSEPAGDVEEAYEEAEEGGAADTVDKSGSQSALSSADPPALSLSVSPSGNDMQALKLPGEDLGEESGRDTVAWGQTSKPRPQSKRHRLMEALEASMDEDSSLMARAGSVDDHTIDTYRTMDTLETAKASPSPADDAANDEEPFHATPVLATVESALTHLVRTTGEHDVSPTGGTAETLGAIAENSAPLPIPHEQQGVDDSVELVVGGEDDYDEDDYEDEFESADASALAATADKFVESVIEDESMEEVEEELLETDSDVDHVFAHSAHDISVDVEAVCDAGDQELYGASPVDRSEHAQGDVEDWFEESEEQVQETELNRTMESIGVDVVEDVRSPTRGEKFANRGPSLSMDDSITQVDELEEQESVDNVAEDSVVLHSPRSAQEELTPSEKLQRFMAGRSAEDQQAVAHEVTDILLQRLLVSTLSTAAVKDAAATVDDFNQAPVGGRGEDHEESAGSGASSVSEDMPEMDNVEMGGSDDEAHSQEDKYRGNTGDSLVPARPGVGQEEPVSAGPDDEEGEAYSFDDFDEDAEEDTAIAAMDAVEEIPRAPASSSLTSLSALPALGKGRVGTDSADVSSSESFARRRDASLDDLLGDEDEDDAVSDTKSRLSPRFGKPARARESDSFASSSSQRTESVMDMWSRRKKVCVMVGTCACDGLMLMNVRICVYSGVY